MLSGGDEKLLVALGGEVGTESSATGAVLVTDEVDPKRVRRFLEDGGTAIVLPQKRSFYAAFGMTIESRKDGVFSGAGAGLNAGNFHWRQNLETLVFNGTDDVLAEKPVGKGHLVVVGFDPRTYDCSKEPYLKLTFKRQMRALAQLLTNAGMRLEGASRIISRDMSRKNFCLWEPIGGRGKPTATNGMMQQLDLYPFPFRSCDDPYIRRGW